MADHHVVLPAVSGSDVRSTTNLSAHQFVPLSLSRTLVRVVSNIDLALGGVPSWLLDYVLTKVSHRLIAGLRTQLVRGFALPGRPQTQATAPVGRFTVFERRLRTYIAELEQPNPVSWGPPASGPQTQQPVVLVVDQKAQEGALIPSYWPSSHP